MDGKVLLDDPSGPYLTMGLFRKNGRRVRVERRCDDRSRGQREIRRLHMAGFEVGGWGLEVRNIDSLYKLKKKIARKQIRNSRTAALPRFDF